ncbi:MAG: vanadium-dependent haloperoxidase [Verrucomicrobiota bacterium]
MSQFLLLGNQSLESPQTKSPARKIDDGVILYGAIGIDQKIRIAEEGADYLTHWDPYIDAQNGADFRGQETYASATKGINGFRFIHTPRDLATYVHYDALYEAYLNACIFLLSSGAPFDHGIPFLENDTFDKQQGFAHFGGPHILTLVCEVATRALKAVRYQKFNNHRRLRPEAMGGLYDRSQASSGAFPTALAPFGPVADALNEKTWGGPKGKCFRDVLAAHNAANNKKVYKGEAPSQSDSYLLPMAFPEGSPMHPSYGAGHATVAGACVTILKAYFDHGWTPPAFFENQDRKKNPIAWLSVAGGKKLAAVKLNEPLTVEGELNKLAANIAIGRNWAGVHYYSDYIESIRMGEEIAIGLLEEQKLTYPENFSMTVPLYDGGTVQI